jgi:hypothetical protein
MQRIAKEYGGSVDENGTVVVPRGISSFTGPNSLQQPAARAAQTEEIQRNLKRDVNENASRCGFRCTQCGKIFCLTCLGRDAKTHPVYGGKACFACGGNVKAIDDPTVQAEYYIISYLPPEPDPAKRDVLISRILAANGYAKGTAGVYFAVSASGAESLKAFSMGLMFNYEQRSGKEVDGARTKIHKFGTDAIQGNMIAIFHTGKPYVRKADKTGPDVAATTLPAGMPATIPNVEELISIGRKSAPDGYSASNFLARVPGPVQERAREIGEELNRAGGLQLMLKAHAVVGAKLGGVAARELESAWNGIGEWQG